MQEAERHKKIIDHISSHLGCLTEDLCKAMEKHMARSTFFKDLAKLKEDKIVREEHTNKRDHKLFVDSNNPLIFIPKQLEEIEKTFKTLLDKSKPHWEEISEQRLNALKESNIDLIRELFFKGIKSLVYFVPTMILQMITDSITIHARTIWINKIADKDIINKLFANVFMKLASLNSDYVDYLNSIYYNHLERVQFDNSAINRVYLPLQLMHISRNVYKAISMEKEIEEMFDSLWEFSEDIHIFLFPEIKLYKWDSEYNIRDWRILLEIYENNPDQNAQNYYLLEKQ
jgi:hypothetical protein